MFSIFKKNKAEAHDEDREGSVPHSIEPKSSKHENKRATQEITRAYDLGCQSKLNRKTGGRMFDDYPG